MRHRLAPGLIAALPLLVAACAASAADAPAGGGTAATATSRGSLPMCRTCRVMEPPRGAAPASCPATRPPDPPFVPPAPYPPTPPSVVDEKFWYGTNQLWTWLNADGTWEMAHDQHGLFDKSVWWRQGYDWRTETTPRLQVTGRRLDAPAPAITISGATNGFEQFMGAFMLVGLELPAGGCWELTGHYHDSSLRFVVWVTSEQP
jgi:hypothetical protein